MFDFGFTAAFGYAVGQAVIGLIAIGVITLLCLAYVLIASCVDTWKEAMRKRR